jgi:PAS domain S-box-containing protein/diguanylate cyclase (GGDEF)-like protein
MVGEDADRGDSRQELRASRRAGAARRQDLETGSLATWSRALDDQRREVLAGVGHELKTPLSIVLGLCGRLMATELDDSQTQDVERVRANAYVLLKRVEELLQVSRLDGGHLELELRDVDVARLVRASCEGFASVAELRGQQLVVDVPPELPAHVDEEKLLSVVSNLLANALKHAPTGGIVRCSVTSTGERLRIEVADNGPGVADAMREEIFERYRQGAGSASRPGGTGLGLAIVRDLVALHRGMVTLADAPEGGALFAVDLPLRTEGVTRAGQAAPPPTINVAERQRPTVERLRAELSAEGRRGAAPLPAQRGSERPVTLIVTADSELGAFVQELIARRYEVRHASDPLQAARLIAAERPDAVVLDAAAGVRAIAALRRRLGEIPLLTFAASPDDVPGLIAAGAQDCVVKPFAAEELHARLDALVARGRAATRRETTLAGLDRAFVAAPLAMALVAADGRLVRVNRALCGLLGFSAEELTQRTVQDLTHPAELGDEETRRRAVLDRRIMADRGTWRLARADGSYVHVSASASLVDYADGAEPCLLWHISDTVDEQRTGADVLAGPPGRRAFERAVRHQLLRCRRYGEQAALVRCSLDGLPAVRAEHGTDVADRLTAAILDAVGRRLRSTDVVAYVDDKEIAVLLAHADLDAARTTAEALREAAESQQVTTVDGPVGTDAEVGVASLARAGSPGRAFVEAGLAMHGQRGDTPRLRRFPRAGTSPASDARLGRG